MNCKLQVRSIDDITMIIMRHWLSSFSRFNYQKGKRICDSAHGNIHHIV